MRPRYFVLSCLVVGVFGAQAAAEGLPAAAVGPIAPAGSTAAVGSAAPAGSGSATALPPPPPPAPSGSAPAPPPPAPGGAPPAGARPAYPYPPPAYPGRGYPAYGPPGYGRPGYYGPRPYYASPEPPPPPKPRGVRLHDGFYFRADLGFGYLSESATFKSGGVSADQTQRGGAGSMLILFGGTPATGLAFGGGMFFASAGSPRTGGATTPIRGDLDSMSLFGLMGFADYYFNPKGGFHVLGLVGFGGLSWNAKDGSQSTSSEEPAGLLLGLGAGYDFWVSDQWSLGLLGRLVYAPLSTSYTSDATTQRVDYSSDVLVPVIALTVLDH